VLAALLFGTLRAGATRMQSVAQIPVDIISILQAMIIIFIAAPEIIRAIYRLKQPEIKEPTPASGSDLEGAQA
jgi:simple sugar transport system permease protein